MKPDFALSLTSTGITLLLRGAGGWRNVGVVSLEAQDLVTELAILRSKGEDLGLPNLQAKIIIPNEQIRYMSITTGDLPAQERLRAAEIALQGATPYEVSELVIDVSADGASSHVAAVAQETLDEAEAFATEHGFSPVSFVAAPEDHAFLGEPFFGQARCAKDLYVQPDGIAVVDIGPLPPAAEQAPKEEPSLYGEQVEMELAPKSSDKILLPVAPPIELTANAASKAPLVLAIDANPPPDEVTPEPAGPVVGFSSRRRKSSETAADEIVKTEPKAPKVTSVSATKAPVSAPAGALPAAPSFATPALANTTSAPAKKPISARPVQAPARSITDMPQANPLVARKRNIGLAIAGFSVFAAVGSWAFIQEVPALWSDLARADLVGTEDPIAPPVLASPPSTLAEPLQSASLIAATTPPAGVSRSIAPNLSQDSTALTMGSLTEGDKLDTDQAHIESASFTPSSAIDDAILAALPDPIINEDAPLQGQELITASLPSAAEQSGHFDDADFPDDAHVVDPEALADGIAPTEQHLQTIEEAAQYAATGIWQKPPALAEAPVPTGIDHLYLASIDHTDLSQDAVALPDPELVKGDDAVPSLASPVPADRSFSLDARGVVVATPDGSLNPDGILIYSGRPSVVPPPSPNRPSEADILAEAQAEQLALLSKKRPRSRPSDLVEQNERAQLGGVSRVELSGLRPKIRPRSAQVVAETAPATERAVASVSKPRIRPSNFANIVNRAQRSSTSETTAAVSASVTPSLPSSASVSRQATVSKALNLRQINLIGVYGTTKDPRALVRLPSGRYVKVSVGDRLDGGRIVAIGKTQLQYQKGGRNRTLSLPKG